ncbi:universal stress protein [Luteococcus sp. Sow4_B9]|uniref:universal stress protein n=1 Tax=Luteococcus sp. Sow4_B9 TaxID=3438792 RepID=UPI003F979D01
MSTINSAGRVVVGTDGSEQSAIATEWAARRAQDLGVGLTLVLALPPLQVPSRGSLMQMLRDSATDFTGKVIASARHRLAEAAEKVRTDHPDLDVEAVLLEDSEPALALVQATRDAAVVVTGTRGLGAVKAMALGSVSRHLISHARGPVVVVPETGIARESHAVGTVAVGVDDASHSSPTLHAAIAEARRTGGKLLVVHSWEYNPVTVDGMPAMDQELFVQVQQTHAKELEDMVREQMDGGPDVEVEVRVSLGHAGEVLVNSSHEAELLVVGSRGRSGLSGVLLGSTAAHVVRTSICPVLVVPSAA